MDTASIQQVRRFNRVVTKNAPTVANTSAANTSLLMGRSISLNRTLSRHDAVRLEYRDAECPSSCGGRESRRAHRRAPLPNEFEPYPMPAELAGVDLLRQTADVARAKSAGCVQCHQSATVARLTPTRSFCLTCHSPKVDHYAPTECTECHFQASPETYRPHLSRPVRGP